MKRTVELIKNVTFLWAFAATVIASSLLFIEENMDWLNANFTSVLFIGLIILWFKVVIGYVMTHNKMNQGFRDIAVSQLKADVDRFFNEHKNDAYLTEDEMSYVYMLRDKCEYHGVNSFTFRKIEHLLKKEIK